MSDQPTEPQGPLADFPEEDLDHFWPSLLRAVGTEPRAIESVRGISGVDHRFVAAGVDEPGGRIVLISNEGQASAAALAQADLQAALTDKGLQVVVARPLIVDLAAIGRSAQALGGKPMLTTRDLSAASADGTESKERLMQLLGPVIVQVKTAMSVGSIGFMQGLVQVSEQLPKLKWGDLTDDDPDAPLVDLSALMEISLGPDDADLGVCPIPLVEFTPDELEIVNGGTDSDQIEEILHRRNVLQYFFPPPDETALALIQRGFSSPSEILEAIGTAPRIGHPLGPSALTPAATKLPDLIEALHDKKLVVESAEISGVELSELGEGAMVNLTVRTRESFISKLINRVELRVNLKSLLKIG